jgi:uncharacterized protein YndB with AHSA1/START domain
MAYAKLDIKAALKVSKPAHEVFEAIVDPSKMSNYFIAQSTGRMEGGKSLKWKFPEFDMEIPVQVITVEKDKLISYSWGDMDGSTTTVEIKLRPMDDGSTFVSVTEKEKNNDDAGIDWLRRNTEGWANFLACLKAWLEYGIHLRKNAFESSQMPEKDITV